MSVEGSAARLVRFLETHEVTPELFTDDVFCDFTPPLGRYQAIGVDNVVAIRTRNHPAGGRVVGRRCDPTPTGYVVEIEERWEHQGKSWYARELIRVDLRDDRIAAISVYCTGDWDARKYDDHARSLLRV